MLLVVLAAVLLMPTALALDQEEILQDQSQSLGIEDLEEAERPTPASMTLRMAWTWAPLSATWPRPARGPWGAW